MRLHLALFVLLAAITQQPRAQSVTVPFVADWQFTRAAVDLGSASQSGFDATGWEAVRLPHDWAIAGPFDVAAHGSTGKMPWKGEGWYRRTFTLDGTRDERRVYFDFDGVMAFPNVYINGELAGEWDYGYTPFRVDATDHVQWGQENTILVHVDTDRWGSRWYPGAGIYRKVTLTVAPPVHLARWGTHVWTNGDELGGHPADTAWIETTVENHLATERDLVLIHRLLAPDGSVLATKRQSARVPSHGRVIRKESFEVDAPLLWDVDHPHLYTVSTSLEVDGAEQDRADTRFGFRTFAFTADDGFHLNGRRVQMQGVNLHHDLGPLGSAFNEVAARRQLEIMKEMGVNALRTSHNPAAPEVIRICDELGILVFDEMFDKWDWSAGRADLQPPLSEFGHRHIRNTVLRDRNSPSVVLWSIGNELGGEDRFEGINPERVAMMTGFVRAYDATRPVGMGNHIPELTDGQNFASLDVNGWNYARRYARYRAVWPDKPIIYSESASALSTRGYYDPELAVRPTDYDSSYQVSSYDLTAAAWSDIADREFRLMEEDRFVAGEFVWTGFDYLGEPTPFDREARSSYFGIVDLCGFPKDRYFLYRSHWRPDETTVHILPHWNWPDRVGRNVPVFVYTNGDAAELFLNGRSLGTRRKGEVPPRAPNLALGAQASASSAQQPAVLAHDGSIETGWMAAQGDSAAWWQVDLGAVEHVRFVGLDTPRKENLYAWTLSASVDGERWEILATKPTARFPLWSGPSRVFHDIDAEARYLRVVFTEAREGAPIGLNTFAAYGERVESEYYDATYDYRLRWNEVSYEPGKLRAVAYRDGVPIGEAVVETTGPQTAIRLSAKRTALEADGEDLAFITVEAVDADGRPNPLATDRIRFSVRGPASVAGLCSGNPMSFEPFQGAERKLFYGKALVVLRPDAGEGGDIELVAEADGLAPATLRLKANKRH